MAFRGPHASGQTVKNLRVDPLLAGLINLDSREELKLQFLRKVERTQGIPLDSS